jgi:hypothetical protein
MGFSFVYGVIAVASTVAAATYLTGRRVPWRAA